MLNINESEILIRIKLPRTIRALALCLILKYRKIRFGCQFRKIPLTQNEFALVDPDDYPQLCKYKWFLAKGKNTNYAARWHRPPNSKKRKKIPMHRHILKPPPNLLVDHINHNGLDNRRQNLRLATHSQNLANRKKTTSKTLSKYKGLEFDKTTKKFKARITVKGKKIFLGSFNSETQAARAYDKAATKHFRNFACLNFPTKK
jgi:hypothetical protein